MIVLQNLEGTVLDADGLNCRGVDMCAVANGGCSHECYTTYGKSFCMCPAGRSSRILTSRFRLGSNFVFPD